ncbi:MAG: D-alanine--D-alanine ligase [Deltaproteobacteria bacterium]
MEYKNKKIGVLMGGLSAEREISLRSGNACLKALTSRGYNAVAIDALRDLPFRLRDEGIEVAFVALHGRYGEDGTVQGLLEVLGIPYTGSGVLASAIAINKAVTKEILRSKGVRTPGFIAVNRIEDVRELKISLPVVVKPVKEGSTIGISIVRDRENLISAVEEAFRYDTLVLIEDFVKGREVTVSLLDGRPMAIVEVRPKSGFYDFKSKYTAGMTEYMCPADISNEISKVCREMAVDVYDAVGCSGAARVDIIIDEGGPQAIEINTIPGMTETSLLPKAAACEGMSFDELVERMLDGASLKG